MMNNHFIFVDFLVRRSLFSPVRLYYGFQTIPYSHRYHNVITPKRLIIAMATRVKYP